MAICQYQQSNHVKLNMDHEVLQRALSSIERGLTKVEEFLLLLQQNRVPGPLHFGASKSMLTTVKGDMVGCNGDCYAMSPLRLH